jgi:HEAT repeat protein
MKTLNVFLIPIAVFAADQAPVQQLFDAKLSPTRRATACFELRGNADRDVINALSRALEDPDLISCAADNLRLVGAIEPLKTALSSPEAPVRAAAARELGSFQKLDLLEPLALAAGDVNALVSSNALAGLSQYDDPAVIPYLAAIAKKGGMTGDMALDRISEIDSKTALSVARDLLGSDQVPDKLYAMRVIGSFGSNSDLPPLRRIASSGQETLAQRDRGFGFMPGINLARAAQSAIASIETRDRR